MMLLNDNDKAKYANVWVIAEALDGKIQSVTHELLGAAKNLADERGSQVWGVAIGYGVAQDANSLFAYGADKVILVDDERLKGFNDELECNVLIRLIEKYLPESVLGAATSRGRALIPRVAVKTYSGLTADCTGLGIDAENGDLLQTRPAFGGNIMATIRSGNHRPQMATVRPKVMNAIKPDASRKGETIIEHVLESDANNVKKILEILRSDEAAVNLSDARIIVSGGRAMKGSEGFRLLQKFADKIGGAVGASRAAVDNGWIAYPHQVGQTGQTVQTSVYIACGISGQIQHLIGMQSCETIVAIDRKPDTPMMQLADIAIVGDVFEVIPAIVQELENGKTVRPSKNTCSCGSFQNGSL
jgi:electron transfer flavoprotein alpha subunit